MKALIKNCCGGETANQDHNQSRPSPTKGLMATKATFSKYEDPHKNIHLFNTAVQGMFKKKSRADI